MAGFDYVIIGAGSAGCVLANRLGANKRKRILILEAGPMDRDLMIHMPAGVYKSWRDPKYNWNYHSAPEPSLNGREIFIPRGKVVGGSSSINAMVYMRGHPLDYDGWAQEPGMGRWRYADCLPYFKAGETYDQGGDAWRGDRGPLDVARGNYDNPLYDAFIEAGAQAGQGQSKDLNGSNPEGVARYDATKRNGRRCSAAVAHLRPALKRGNVTLVTSALVSKVVIQNGRTTGVAFQHDGQTYHEDAGEVILSGGAINSPQLLMLSGIGPADHLREHDIPVVADLPGVGRNLQDHASVILQYECRKLFPIHRIDNPFRKLGAGARWVFFRDGAAASNIWEAGGLIRGNDRVAYPDIQYHFGPVGFEYEGNKISVSQAFSCHVDHQRPRSRGCVALRSNNAKDAPLLNFSYLADPLDMADLVAGVKKAREVFAQPAFDGLRGVELSPGPDVKTDEDIAAWIRQDVGTDFHPSGTCRMGMNADCVVDPEFKVHGIGGLRVVDASAMPRITSANLNAPVQMMAARAADFIAGRKQLPPEQPGPVFE